MFYFYTEDAITHLTNVQQFHTAHLNKLPPKDTNVIRFVGVPVNKQKICTYFAIAWDSEYR